MKVVVIIQARIGSTRLPGKVLMDIAGHTMLAQVVERTQRAKFADAVVVATTNSPADDAIVAECARLGSLVFRGDEHDVLARYCHAAAAHGADLVVRVTSDCPLIDPEIIDSHIERTMERWHEVDFVTNMIKQTYQLGLAVETMPVDVLKRMNRMSTTAYLREHVTTLAYEKPEWFSIEHICNTKDLSAMRWTVDTREDLEFVRHIFGEFSDNRFAWTEVLQILAKRPEWLAINRPPRQQPA
jgi:spore coat polysaccharide biosynthesis protein SpsF